MSTLDIYCYNSFSSAWINCPATKEEHHLFVGNSKDNRYFSCLYFQLPPAEQLGSIQNVTLYLFRTPLIPFHHCIDDSITLVPYLLYPLKAFYTQYSYRTSPILDYDNGQSFYANPHASETSINITQLAKNWVAGTVPNKGLILLGTLPNQLIAYGSYYSGYPDIVPFLRITYIPLASTDTHPIIEGTTLDLTVSSKIYVGPL